jgi:RNA-directed DNA polymerase
MKIYLNKMIRSFIGESMPIRQFIQDYYKNQRNISLNDGDYTGESVKNWNEIDWKKAQVKLQEKQEKIVMALHVKDIRRVYLYQIQLTQTFAARALAVRKVVTNSGGNTAGVDGIVWKGSAEYLEAIKQLQEIIQNPKRYKASPLRRVWIPKNKTEKRPLGIPTMIDRATQALYNFALDPVVETMGDPHSFGLRRGRSTQDAVLSFKKIMNTSNPPGWVLEADIRKCFDRIDHQFLLDKAPLIHKHMLRQW